MKIKRSIILLMLFLGTVFNLDARIVKSAPIATHAKLEQSLEKFLLPATHSLHSKLKKILKDPSIFLSSQFFTRAGFILNPRVHLGLMVAKHPQIKGYLIKKYRTTIPLKMQLENYIKRIKGAKILKKYIEEHSFKHLVVPDKWLYELPANFSIKGVKSYLLIVEDMNLCEGADNPNSENGQHYYNMNKEVFVELCTLMHELGGCDAYPRNQTFTKSGKIAFIDTEHVGSKKSHFPNNIIPLLNEDLREQAQSFWDELELQEHSKTTN